MAVYPCTIGAHRYRQAQMSAYVSNVTNAMRPETLKHRLCPRHFVELEDSAKTLLTLIDDEGGQMSAFCEFDGCNEPRAGSVFLKLYGENGAEPDQYAGDFCGAHQGAVLAGLSFTSGLPLGS